MIARILLGHWMAALLLGCSAVGWSGVLAAAETAAEPERPSVPLTDAERDYLADLQPLRVPLVAGQPPVSYLKDGQPAGYLNDLLDHVAAMLGITVERIGGLNYQQSVHALQSGSADLLNAYSAFGDGRPMTLHTRPVLRVPFVAVGRVVEGGAVKSTRDLAGKRLVMVSGFQQTQTLQARYPQLDIRLVDRIDEAYRSLRAREADYYIDNASHAGYYLREHLVTDLQIAGELPREELGVLEFRFAVHRDAPLLHAALQKALDAMDRSEFLALRDKWLSGEPAAPLLELTREERAWLDRHPVIRLASDYAWPPFESIDENGRYRGIAADYMRLLERRLGIEFVISPRRPWSEITTMVQDRELDVFSLAMETEQRRAYARFTAPYVSNPMIIVTDDRVGYVDGLDGLHGKTIAIERGYASFDLLSRQHPELQLRPYPDSLSAMLAVSKGEAFAYIGNIANLSYIMRNHGVANIKVSGQIPYKFELSMGVRSDWPELVPILQKALDSISLDEKNAILQKWISVDVEPGTDYTRIWQVAAVLLLLFLGVLYWNLMLNRMVRARTSQLQHQAHFDALTDLPNRFLAFDRLAHLISEARRAEALVALLFLDLDDFKKINDTLGHEVGDRLLVRVAERLRNAVRGEDTVARLGGDEFIILLGGLKTAADAGLVAEKLLACFGNAFNQDGRELLFTASIGIAVFPGDGDDSSTLLRNADSAMYHAKREGRNTYAYFTDTMNQEVSRRLLVESCMHGALERGEFTLHYQPKLDVRSRDIVGFEALMRWHSPELGEVSPYEFIPVAEHNGMISSMGRFVLSTGLLAVAAWQRRHDRPLSLAVNLSPRQFRDPELVQHIASALAESGVRPDALELEITEGVLMSGQSFVDQALGDLKRLGVAIAMDDFGTGYSSLSYLRKYPFDTVKIDREFIKDITTNTADHELANAAIAMSHSLGLKVVAEGVETEQQLALLAAKGCDLAQGYLFSRPLPAAQIDGLLQSPERLRRQQPAG
jgi:diguanylate cyclase (GGDEF)-like protein